MREPVQECVLAHLFRVIGMGRLLTSGSITIFARPKASSDIAALAEQGAFAIALDPDQGMVNELGGSIAASPGDAWKAVYLPEPDAPFAHMRGFGPVQTVSGDGFEPVLRREDGSVLWAWRGIGKGGVLLVGTDLVADLLRFRQGDANRKPTESDLVKYDYAGERADYLFEADFDTGQPHDRPADWPLFAIQHFAAQKLGRKGESLLPGDAACALMITGDTDVATEAHYAKQRQLLADLPITYFLRMACAPDVGVLKSLEQDDRVDLQIHPDALDAPDRYGALLGEQTGLFESAIGRRPHSLRNHGYLNSGYWRHALDWESNGYTWSSNIAGVGGNVLNRSLLPARLCLDGRLTRHWSVLTLYGDGMIFALNLTDAAAAARMEEHVDEIMQLNTPAVFVVNLHPVNVEQTPEMHRALHRIVEKGALPWSMKQCADWFEKQDS